MTPYQVTSPVLFLVFNRLDTTRRVFETIRAAKPPRLYVACDGPRAGRTGEDEKVALVRQHVMEGVDWPCEVITLFRDANLGCKMAVSQAISWFFEHEPHGIILEDDCLADESFFRFCDEMLERYKGDLRVWQISGNNFDFGERRDTDYSYHFSYYGSIWGWATWRDRWAHYDVQVGIYSEIRQKNYLWDVFGNQEEADARAARLDQIHTIDTWDFQWAFTRYINSGLSAMPCTNLVENLGFGADATHTHGTDDVRATMQTATIAFPLLHPPFLIRDKRADDRYFERFIKRYNGSRNPLRRLQKTLGLAR